MGGHSYTYADAGVSIDAGNALVRRIAPLARATARAGADGALGGFGGLFDLRAAGFSDPVLVAATDGVGTKVKLAIETGRHEGIGIDLVAMCVNDLLASGAEPLFFLDYFASGKLELPIAEAVVASIAEGCAQAGCALIGGETAEMPGIYAPGDYDLAGFSVGAFERGRGLTGEDVAPGDVLLGLASSGVHANGFSLVRRLAADKGWALDAPVPFEGEGTLADALLAPTRIYVRAVLPQVRARRVKAVAHVTGGGLLENLPRILPQGARAAVDAAVWRLPPLFSWLQVEGAIATTEMARTFNCGVGLVVVVAAENADAVADALRMAGEHAFPIGRIEAGPRGCDVTGPAGAWNSPDAWHASYDA